MFNSISNNFGAGVIQFKEARESNYLVLNAKFTYNTTNADYQAADTLEITVPDLPFERSAVAGVFMRFVDRGTKSGYPYISDGVTVLKTWIKDKNTICILPVVEYENLASYNIFFLTTFIPENLSGSRHTFTPPAEISPTVLRGAASNLSVVTFNGVLWQALVIMADSLTFDETEEDVKIDLQGYPSANFDFLPIIYTDGISNTYGSKFYPASLQNGVLTIKKDSSADESASATKKFLKAAFVPMAYYDRTYGDE